MTSEFVVAVHAVVCLCHKRGPLSSEQLAKSICTNPARIRKVMAKLKKAGLVSTKEGAEGGYRFDGDASKVTLREMLDAVGERAVSASWRSGNADLPCLIASGMADVMDELHSSLDRICREQLSRVTVADIDRKISGQTE